MLQVVIWKEGQSNNGLKQLQNYFAVLPYHVTVMDTPPLPASFTDLDTYRYVLSTSLIQNEITYLLIIKDTCTIPSVSYSILNELMNRTNLSIVFLSKYNDKCDQYTSWYPISSDYALAGSYNAEGWEAVLLSPNAIKTLQSYRDMYSLVSDDVVNNVSSSIPNSPIDSPRIGSMTAPYTLYDTIFSLEKQNKLVLQVMQPSLFPSLVNTTECWDNSVPPKSIQEKPKGIAFFDPTKLYSSSSSSPDDNDFEDTTTIQSPSETTEDISVSKSDQKEEESTKEVVLLETKKSPLEKVYTPTTTETILYSWWFWLVIFLLLIILLLLILFGYRSRL